MIPDVEPGSFADLSKPSSEAIFVRPHLFERRPILLQQFGLVRGPIGDPNGFSVGFITSGHRIGQHRQTPPILGFREKWIGVQKGPGADRWATPSALLAQLPHLARQNPLLAKGYESFQSLQSSAARKMLTSFDFDLEVSDRHLFTYSTSPC